MLIDDLKTLSETIAELCRKEQGIIAAYLFGSSVTRDVRKARDIDVAILVEPVEADDFPLLAFASHLERVCGRPVDLVLLNRAGEVLKYQVRRFGRLIFERDPVRRKQFEIKGRKLYEDFLHLHRRYVRMVLYGVRNP